jgi:hypothetical protein
MNFSRTFPEHLFFNKIQGHFQDILTVFNIPGHFQEFKKFKDAYEPCAPPVRPKGGPGVLPPENF